MKRILFAVLMMMLSNLTFAKFSSLSDTTSFKPTKGTLTTELNFNPFKGNLSLNNALNQIKARYFVADDVALRLGFGIDLIDSAVNYGNPYGTQSYFNSSDRKRTGVDINIGIEKHFPGTKRLSPYVGIDLSWGKRSSKQHISTSAYEMNIKNGWMDIVYIANGSYNYSSTQIVQNAYTRFGAYAFAGFDFYLAKNLFLGYEFNLGYLKTDYKTPDVTVTGQNPNIGTYVSNNSTKSFKSSVINGIRLGYSF